MYQLHKFIGMNEDGEVAVWTQRAKDREKAAEILFKRDKSFRLVHADPRTAKDEEPYLKTD